MNKLTPPRPPALDVIVESDLQLHNPRHFRAVLRGLVKALGAEPSRRDRWRRVPSVGWSVVLSSGEVLVIADAPQPDAALLVPNIRDLAPGPALGLAWRTLRARTFDRLAAS